uniref:U91-Liphistoxin-Lth1a_1 n=1 Tax=Liphistius thaleban TaxID=1905330 RepID=A0A4Q8K4N8_9ARAC
MEKSIILLVVISLLSSGYAGLDYCFNGHQQQCAEDLAAIFEDNPFPTDEVLTNSCSDLLSNVQCIDDYISTCREEILNEYRLYTTSVKALLQDICNTDSALRIAYQQHVTCIRNANFSAVEDEIEECAEALLDEETLERVENFADKANSEDNVVELSCLVFEPVVNCIKQVADKYCSDGAGQLLKDIIERGTAIPRAKFCRNAIETLLDNVAEEILRRRKK